MNRISIDTPGGVAIAADRILSGEVVLYPTDTLYGLGADALSDEAVAKIYAIKGREEGKPIHAIVADMDMAARYGEVDDVARLLADKFLPGPLTLILKKKTGIETGIGNGIDTIGIRIPDNDFCKQLVERFGGPITTTSANPSGIMPARTVAAILDQFEDRADMIALSIDAGELPARAPSTVVDLSGERPVILREGAIPSSEIWEALGILKD